MAFALAATAALGGLAALGLAAALAVFATAVLLAFLHGSFHILAFATRLAVFHVTLVFTATSGGILGVGCGVMAATFAVLHPGHVVMAASLRLRRWG